MINEYIKHPALLALGGFLAAWAGSDFALDHRAVLWAVVAGIFGYAKPIK
jgi:hypothetical protein